MKNKLICIHPTDPDLSFLTPLTEKFSKKLGDDTFQLFSLGRDVKLHYQAQQAIGNATEEDLILFLCHGGTDYILGQHEVAEENAGLYYYKFIASKNIYLLSSKKVLCVSCDSKVRLGKMAIENGCISFVGFGDIQFEDKYHLEHGEGSSKIVIENSNKYMCEILTESILLTILKKGTFQNFIDYFKFFASKRCDSLIFENKRNPEIKRVCNFLWNLKNEIALFGNRNIKLF